MLGLVAVGSMARQGSLPDRWSDHDFFVVVESGTQESFRSNLDWVPRHDEIALSFRETAHGVKAIFRDGHLIEFAVFDPDELALARINRYRALLDRKGSANAVARVAEATAAGATPPLGRWLVGQFLTNLWVGWDATPAARACRRRHRVQGALSGTGRAPLPTCRVFRGGPPGFPRLPAPIRGRLPRSRAPAGRGPQPRDSGGGARPPRHCRRIAPGALSGGGRRGGPALPRTGGPPGIRGELRTIAAGRPRSLAERASRATPRRVRRDRRRPRR